MLCQRQRLQAFGETLLVNLLSWKTNKRAFISIAIGMGAFALIPVVRWSLYEIDHQFANIGTAICLAVGLIAFLVAFLRTANSKQRNLGLIASAVIAIAGLVCFEFRGFTGELVPIFRWRFAEARKATLFSNTPSHATLSSDLAEEAKAATYLQYLGDQRTGVIDAPSLKLDWASNPPTALWRVPIGDGWSGICVANGFAWTLFQDEDREAVVCLDLLSGRELYRRSFTGTHYEPLGGKGPRSTPTWFKGKLVFQTATGQLVCLEASTGEILWQHDLLHLGFENQSESESAIKWGRSGSPLVFSLHDTNEATALVVVPFGGSQKNTDGGTPANRTLIAFDLDSGGEVWRSGNHQISYASPSLLQCDGVTQIVSVNEGFVSGHAIDTGKQLWQIEWPNHSNSDACASQPVQIGSNQILVSKGYAAGAKLVQVRRPTTLARTAVSDDSIDASLQNAPTEPANQEWSADTLWNNHRVLKTKLTSAIHVNGKLYGLSDGILECVEAKTGERIWRKGRYGQGQCLVVNDHLLITSEMGELILVRMEDGEAIYRQKVLDGVCWNYPAVAGPFILMRNGSEIVCFYSGTKQIDTNHKVDDIRGQE